MVHIMVYIMVHMHLILFYAFASGNYALSISSKADSTLLTPRAEGVPNSSNGHDDISARDFYPGFNNTCSSWHIEPAQDNTQLYLVARCTGGDPAVSEGKVCSQIGLEECYYEFEGWLYRTEDPKSIPKDRPILNSARTNTDLDAAATTSAATASNAEEIPAARRNGDDNNNMDWYPDPCHFATLDKVGDPDDPNLIPRHLRWQCEGALSWPPGYSGRKLQDLALTVGNN
ncbi:uncharacterized protein B0I36DRAFT_430150, partial [Microdochium trichocladiopsis]